MNAEEPVVNEIKMNAVDSGAVHDAPVAEFGDEVVQNDTSVMTDSVTANEPELNQTSLHLSGVDELSTKQIKDYIDLHIKPGYSYATRKRYAYLEYELKWINDSEINVVFDHNSNKDWDSRQERRPEHRVKNLSNPVDLFANIKTDAGVSNANEDTSMDVVETQSNQETIQEENDTFQNLLQTESIKGASESMLLLTSFDQIREEHPQFSQLSIEEQIKQVENAPKLEERKCWDLILDPKGKVVKSQEAKDFYRIFNLALHSGDEGFELLNEEPTPDITEEFKFIKLSLRYSVSTDKKVENSKSLSRYYLIHGEPDHVERAKSAKERLTNPVNDGFHKKDLITGEELETQELFGYENDRDVREITDRHPDFEDYSANALPWGRDDGKWRRGGFRRGGGSNWRGNGRGGYAGSRHPVNGRVGKRNRGPARGRRMADKSNEADLFPDFFK